MVMVELGVGGIIWRVLFAVVAIAAVLLSRRPTMAQRIVEAIGLVALFGAAWSVVMLDLSVFTPFLIAAAAAFGLLAVAEARR
jgi:tryptophan-rich sensory protein